jgi:uncharacterized protein YecE (DUF72 family)
MTRKGTIRAGMGGWTFEPWEGTFYPEKLAKAKQLGFAASKVKTIEVNGTYYSGFTPATYAKWAAETPDGFVFSIKGNRFVTNRKILAEAGESMKKFFAQGLEELGPKLGPLVWQFANTKKFDLADFEGFLNRCRVTMRDESCAMQWKCDIRALWFRSFRNSAANLKSPFAMPITPPIPRLPT